jgi:hypothetical protein
VDGQREYRSGTGEISVTFPDGKKATYQTNCCFRRCY